MARRKFLLILRTASGGVVEDTSGTKLGEPRGGVVCQGLEWGYVKPKSPGPSRKAHFNPFKITREGDVASPVFFQLAVVNEGFSSASLLFFEPGSQRVETAIELAGGTIAGYRRHHGSEEITLECDNVTVNGVSNGVIPYSLIRGRF